MSRIGKEPVKIPDGVEIQLTDCGVSVKGPKGTLRQDISKDIIVEINKDENVVTVKPISEEKSLWAKWGLYRVLIRNMVVGVTVGYQKTLVIEGIGYKAEVKGSNVLVSAGYSHPVLYMEKKGVKLTIDGPTKIIVTGIDKQIVGQVAAEIRSIRPPEPYKGKGIRYIDEHIIRKAGKTGVK